MYPKEAVQVIRGTPKIYHSSDHGRRHFCPDCGTGLFYTNAQMLPGIVDVQSGTCDDPNLVPARVHTQVAERIGWTANAHELPAFERFPVRMGRSNALPWRCLRREGYSRSTVSCVRKPLAPVNFSLGG